jgi:hypothetical protein
MQVQQRYTGITPSIPNISAKSGSVVNTTSRPLNSQERYPVHTLCRRLCRPQGRYGQVEKIFPPPRFETQTVYPLAKSCNVAMFFRSGTISCSGPLVSLRVSRKLVSNCLKITPIIFIRYKENWLNTRSNSHKSLASYHLFHPQLRHAYSEKQQKQHTSRHYIRQPITDAALWTVIRFRCAWNKSVAGKVNPN